MSSYFDTYCIECDDSVRALSRVQLGSLFVRGELVSFEEVFLECPHCEALISDARVEGVNLDRAYDVYRYNNGIMSPSEIKSLRGSYGLSLREFSRFLGFGEQTVSRYERGDLPDRAHGNTLVHACSVEGARVLLSQNRSKLSAKSNITLRA